MINNYINNIYNTEETTLYYCDEASEYNITCKLCWDEITKNEFINKINNLHNEIKALNKFDKNEANKIYEKHFKEINPIYKTDHIKIRISRLNKLYEIKAPEIIIEKELELITTLLIINNYALKESVVVN